MTNVHSTAEVDDDVELGAGTVVWHYCQIRRGARIGEDCRIGRGVFIDASVRIGHRVKIQNFVSVYQGVTLEDGVFVGPQVTFTNDLSPRAVTPDLAPKDAHDWILTQTLVRQGASIGANSTIVCGTILGRWCLVGAGSVVTRDVPDHALVVGSPARRIGWVCATGNRHESQEEASACRSCTQERLVDRERES
ncbi:MAG TPA: acyltransferase [Polyangiaceae bacterium]|nr:acyltransferase [Polyangiaceae bacterium]